MGRRLWLGTIALLVTFGCADDLDDEDPFLDDRRDDDVVGPPVGAPASCEGLDGTFVSEDLLLEARTGRRLELDDGALVLTFDEPGGDFVATLDDEPSLEGDFAVFGDRILFSEPLLPGMALLGSMECALARDRLRLEGRVFFDFSDDDRTVVERADLIGWFVRSP